MTHVCVFPHFVDVVAVLATSLSSVPGQNDAAGYTFAYPDESVYNLFQSRPRLCVASA
jgi:hypothetical protein